MKLNNQYYILRHGEAKSNVESINSSWPEKFRNSITKNGVKQVKKSLQKLKGKNIDIIISSDLLRTKQTSELASKLLKVKPKFDKRLREIEFGSLNGSPNGMTFEQLFSSRINGGKIRVKKMESYNNLLKRITSFIKDVERKYKDKNILIVSHQAPLWILENKVNGLTLEQGLKLTPKEKRIKKAELRKLN